MTAPSELPIRPAATVMMLRDFDAGLEVLMLRRTDAAVFSPGAHVFPGGAVDDDDRSDDIAKWCTGLDDLTASAALGVARGGLASYVAAVRECFEEAGLLLATRDGDDDLLSFSVEAFAAHRVAVHRGARTLADICASEGLRLAVNRLVPFSHWITPPGPPRRFDTRFFAAAAPLRQEATPDESEMTSAVWARPAALLDAHASDEIDLILPTQRSLEVLADHDTVASVLQAAAA